MTAKSKLLLPWRGGPDRQSFNHGFYAVLPTLVAIGVWGFVTGIALVKSGMTETMAALMTLIVYAGSAQLTALPLIVSGAPLWLVFVAGFVVNIRFIIFGAALQPFFRHLSWVRRLCLGYVSGDMVFVLFMTRYADAKEKGTPDQFWFYLGIIIPSWICWQLFSFMGIYLGSLVPGTWSLEFAATLALLAITIPLINTRPMAVSVLVAGIVAWAGQPLPLRLGLVAAVIAGVLAGVGTDRLKHKRR